MKKLILLGALSVLFYAVPGYIMLSPSNASAQAAIALKAAQVMAEHPEETKKVAVAIGKGAFDLVDSSTRTKPSKEVFQKYNEILKERKEAIEKIKELDNKVQAARKAKEAPAVIAALKKETEAEIATEEAKVKASIAKWPMVK